MTSEENDKSDSAKSHDSTVEDAIDGSDPRELSNDQNDFSNVDAERAPDNENAGASEAIDTSESTVAKQEVNGPTVPPRIVPILAPKNRLDEFWQSAKACWGNLTWPGDWLLFASGADHQWFRDNPTLSPEEKRRFRTQGLIVCLTATFSGLGALYLFTSLFADVDILPVAGTTFAILFAIVWGAMIFALDKVIVCTMIGRPTGQALFAGSIRLVAAIIIGYVISHPLKILILSDEIDAQYNVNRIEFFNTLPDQARKNLDRTVTDLARFAATDSEGLLQQYAQLAQRLDQAEALIDHYKFAYRWETDGWRAVLPTVPRQYINPINGSLIAPPLSLPNLDQTNEQAIFLQGAISDCDPGDKYAEVEDIIEKLGSKSQQELEAAYDQIRNLARYSPSGGQRLTPAETIKNCSLFELLGVAWEGVPAAISNEMASLRSTDVAMFENFDILFERVADEEAKVEFVENCSTLMLTTSSADRRRLEDVENSENPELDESAKATAVALLAQIEECDLFFPKLTYVTRTQILLELTSFDDQSEVIEGVEREVSAWTIRAISTALFVVFAVMESAPVLAKLAGQAGPYENAIARRRLQSRAEVEDDAQLKMEQANARRLRNEQKAGQIADRSHTISMMIGLREEALERQRKLIMESDGSAEARQKANDIDVAIADRMRALKLEEEDFMTDN